MAKKIIIEAQEPQKTTPPVKEAAAVAVFVIDDKPITMDILKTKVAEYQKLTIKGLDDKKGLGAVRLAKADLRTTRNRLDDVRKDANKPFQDKIESNNKLAKDLNAIMNPVEDELDTKLDDHEKLVTAEKERKAEEIKKRNVARKENIIKLGYELDEKLNILSLPDKSNVVNMSLVDQMNDKEYQMLLKTIVDASVVYQAYLVEQKALDVVETNRKAIIAALEAKYDLEIRYAGNPIDLRTMTVDQFDAHLQEVAMGYETEQKRRDEETKFTQLVADREVQIKDLYHSYQLPFGFFPDTTAIAGIKEPDVYTVEFEKMKTAAIADKKRRDDDKMELETLRNNKVSVPSGPAPTIADAPVEPDVIDNEEPQGGIELMEARLDDPNTELLDTKEAKDAAVDLIFKEPETVTIGIEIIKFITEMGMNVAAGGKFYTSLPFWIEIVNDKSGLVKFYPSDRLDQLPEELNDKLKENW